MSHGLIEIIAYGTGVDPFFYDVSYRVKFLFIIRISTLKQAGLSRNRSFDLRIKIVMKIFKMCVHDKSESQTVCNRLVQLAHMNRAEAGLVGDLSCIRFHK